MHEVMHGMLGRQKCLYCVWLYIYIHIYIIDVFAAKDQEPKNKSQGPGERSWAVALISEFTNQNACELNVYSGSFSPPSACRTVTHVGPRTKDQESRSRTQGPGNQEQCMHG